MDDARHRRPEAASLIAIGLALLAIGAATLTPQRPGTPTVPWYLPFANPGDGADALLNVVLFVPLGIALGLAGLPRRRSVVIALAVTVAVELLQGLVVPGRQASIGDVLTNSAGGWLGHLLAPALVAAWGARGAGARRLAIAYGAAWLAGTVATAALLRPDLPAAAAEPARCGRRNLIDCFPGRLVGPVRLQEPGRPDVDVVEGRLVPVGREASIALELVDGGRTIRPGRVGGVATRPGGALMTLEQGDHWLVFHARTRGARWGLRTPAAAMPGVLGQRGNRLSVRAGVTGNVRWLEVGQRRVELRLSGADGWRLLFPWSASNPAIIRAVGALFHAMALLPLAFWATRAVAGGVTHARLAGSAGALVVVATAFVGASLGLGLSIARGADWAGAVAGAVVGALVGGRARRRQPR